MERATREKRKRVYDKNKEMTENYSERKKKED